MPCADLPFRFVFWLCESTDDVFVSVLPPIFISPPTHSCMPRPPKAIRPSGGGRCLLVAAYAPATYDKYVREARDFWVYCVRLDLPVSTVGELDQALYEYFEFLYGLGYGASKGAAASAAIGSLLPEFRDRLFTSQLALRGWRKLRPTVSHPPLTWQLAVVAAVRLRWLCCRTLSVAVLVQFDAMLRVGELLKLRRSDVAFSDDLRLGMSQRSKPYVVLRVAAAKTGVNQSAMLTDPHVMAVLREYMRLWVPVDSDALLFPVSLQALYQWWGEAFRGLGLSSSYTTHSLRHGGATRLLLQGESIETILVRGRWAATKSARTYLNASKGLLLAQTYPPALLAHAEVLAEDVSLSLLTVDRALASRGKFQMCW